MSDTPIQSELVRSLALLLDETNLTEIEYDTGSLRIRVARQGSPLPPAYYAPPPVAAHAAAPV